VLSAARNIVKIISANVTGLDGCESFVDSWPFMARCATRGKTNMMVKASSGIDEE
jgi:hypothetical protein